MSGEARSEIGSTNHQLALIFEQLSTLRRHRERMDKNASSAHARIADLEDRLATLQVEIAHKSEATR